jgi:hypothetical protein
MTDNAHEDPATVEQRSTVEEQLQELRDEVTALQDQIDGVTTLTGQAAGHSAAPASQPPEPTPPPGPTSITAPRTGRAWRTMTADQAAEAWRTLFDFVDWMTRRYDLHDTLPPCWFRHGIFIEELHALYLAWAGAYLHPTARPTDPTSWHELQHRALARLREADRLGCIAGTHRETPKRTGDEEGEARAARAAYAYADVHRRTRQSPEATPA